MKNSEIELTRSELMNHIHYDPDTGQFTRIGYRDCHANLVSCNYPIVGKNKNAGYVRCNILGRRYLLHTLAFMYMGEVVPEVVDHIDGDTTNNSWDNIRSTSITGNMTNKKLYSNSPTGKIGVAFKDGKYYAHIQKGHKREFRGYFETIEEAIEARETLEKELGFHPNHGRVA